MEPTGEIQILVNELNNRLMYVLRHVFSKMLGLRPIITNDEESFLKFQGFKLNYSRTKYADELYIHPAGLVYKKGIQPVYAGVDFINEMPVLFKAETEDGCDAGFDIFSSIFFVISRYEEYLPFEKDHHNRFRPECSVLFKHELYRKPLVDIWTEELKRILKNRYQDITFTVHHFQNQPTIDIDNAFAYKYRGVFRTFFAFVRDILTLRIYTFQDRLRTLMRMKADPYDTFVFLRTCLYNCHPKPYFFFLSGKRSKYDTNISLKQGMMAKVISNVAEYAHIGLHASYASSKKKRDYLIGKELTMLENVSNRKVSANRQHYIKLHLPDTYQHLIKYGIKEDFSMGYASDYGFRAGTCHPFMFYDLQKEKETPLLLVPFVAMDATFSTYLKYTPEQAQEIIDNLKQTVEKYQGTLCIIWHNETFAPTKAGMAWRKVFERLYNG
ncbi:MAG TPA: polysaccharide deacetylase family protein [Bacteroidales bacterium]|nr:polysaccharide deacetylase family protein [Bacteroidales bacterium]